MRDQNKYWRAFHQEEKRAHLKEAKALEALNKTRDKRDHTRSLLRVLSAEVTAVQMNMQPGFDEDDNIFQNMKTKGKHKQSYEIGRRKK